MDDPTRPMPTRRTVLAGIAALAAPALIAARPAAAQGLARAAGSLLVLGFSGNAVDAAGARGLIAHVEAGNAIGALVLGHNVGTRPAVTALATALRDAAPDGLPAVVTVDQEGGRVQRLGSAIGFTAMPRPFEIAAALTPEEARSFYATVATEVRGAGFTVSLGPVVDLHDEGNPVIAAHGRAFSSDPATVVRYAAAFIEAHRAAGVATSLKHFPGHGTSRGDTHDGFVDIAATWRRADELAPFAALIDGGQADMVMTAHVSHPAFGPYPASLSPQAIGGILRGELGFAGPVVTDDLDMGAIRNNYGLETAVIQSIAAGNDLILLSNSLTPDPDLPRVAIGWITAAVADGRLSGTRVEEAAARVAALRAGLRRG